MHVRTACIFYSKFNKVIPTYMYTNTGYRAGIRRRENLLSISIIIFPNSNSPHNIQILDKMVHMVVVVVVVVEAEEVDGQKVLLDLRIHRRILYQHIQTEPRRSREQKCRRSPTGETIY